MPCKYQRGDRLSLGRNEPADVTVHWNCSFLNALQAAYWVIQTSLQHPGPITTVPSPKGQLSLILETRQRDDNAPGSAMQMQEACQEHCWPMESWVISTTAHSSLLSHYWGGREGVSQAMWYIPGVPRATTEYISHMAPKCHSKLLWGDNWKRLLILHGNNLLKWKPDHQGFPLKSILANKHQKCL